MQIRIIVAAPFAVVAAASHAGPIEPDPGASPTASAATVSPVTAGAAFDRPSDTDRDRPFQLSLGTSFAHGDFGSADHTSIWSTALSARYATGNLRLTASIPYMRIRSRGVIFTGIDSTPVVVAASGNARRVTNDGLGDLTVGAAYSLPARPGGLEVEVNGRIKFATASRDSGLSSRKTDYSAGIQITRPVGSFAPFVSASYRVLGDPAGFRLHDGLSASVGTSAAIDERTVVLASYHYSERASRFIPDGHELFAGGSRRLGDRLRLTGYTTVGLSSGAAGVSGGLSLAIDL